MFKRSAFALLTLAACSLYAPAQDTIRDLLGFPGDPPAYALMGATVHVGDGQVLQGATVVIREGLIESVGSGQPPSDALKIDLSGMHIYPGLIDAFTHQGLRKPPAAGNRPSAGQRPGGPGGGSGNPAENREGPGLFAHVSAADRIDPGIGDKLESFHKHGIVAFNLAPNQGIFQGQTALVNLSRGDVDRMIVRSPIAMSMSFRGVGGGVYPGSLMGVISHMRQTFLDTQHYTAAHEIYDRNPRGLKRPQTDRALDAIAPYIKGQRPVIFAATRAREIRRVLKMSNQFNLRSIVAGGFEADQTASELASANVPVLFSLNFPKKPRDQHPEFKEGLATIRYRVNAPAVPSKLQQAGIKFAFYGGTNNSKDYLDGVRKVVERGLDKGHALRAATLSAAEILGFDAQLGSLEQGKIANLAIADGDLFESGTNVRHVFADGQKFDLPVAPRRKAGEGDTADVGEGAGLAGRWQVTVNAPTGAQSLEFDLSVAGSTVEGRVISEMMGAMSIENGTLDGEGFNFSVTIETGQGSAEISFAGKLNGESLEGTATVAGMGTAPFEGTKIP